MTGKSTWSTFTKQQPNTWTAPVTVVYGSYSWLNDAPIHYCLATLSIKSIWDDVRLMHEIPGVEKWGFEAIFQRVIRDDWVKQIKIGYLSNSERFKFFPPVTIALLPCTSDAILRKYDDSDAITFAEHSEVGYVASVPGIEMHFPTAASPAFPRFGAPAMVRWDKARYAALAIDGQHRISALRQFIPRTSQDSESKDVPATILIFDPQLPSGRDLINVTREIFIDINKNAKAVDSSRLILLDDRNFYNMLTRRLILQAYPDGETPSDLAFRPVEEGANLLVPDGIPQELIDTAAGKEAADVTKIKPWQYTSAFILNRTLQYFFFENKFGTFEKLLETVDWRTDSEVEVERVVSDRRDQILAADPGEEGAEFAEKEDVSFNPSITEALVERFIRMYSALVLGVYTAFAPYRRHVESFALAATSDLGGDLRSLMLAEGSVPARKTEDLYKSYVAEELKTDDQRFKKIKKSLSDIGRAKGWESNLVWYSIFQRGLLYQPQLLRTAIEHGRGAPFQSREEFATAYVSILNDLYEEGWFERDKEVEGQRIWCGIALKIGESADPPLDGSDGGARRTGLLTRVLVMGRVAAMGPGLAGLRLILTKHGVSNAKSSTITGWARFAKSLDAIAGSLKEDDHYKRAAEKSFDALLRNLSDPGLM